MVTLDHKYELNNFMFLLVPYNKKSRCAICRHKYKLKDKRSDSIQPSNTSAKLWIHIWACHFRKNIDYMERPQRREMRDLKKISNMRKDRHRALAFRHQMETY